MHGEDNNQDAIFSYESLEKRKPVDRPLRPILAVRASGTKWMVLVTASGPQREHPPWRSFFATEWLPNHPEIQQGELQKAKISTFNWCRKAGRVRGLGIYVMTGQKQGTGQAEVGFGFSQTEVDECLSDIRGLVGLLGIGWVRKQ